MIVLLALVSTVIGHSALNYAMQHLRGQTVSAVNMAQFIVAGVIAWFLCQEKPSPGFYISSFILLFAIGLVMLNQAKSND